MKITRVSIDGFMGIDRAELPLGHVNVFLGANASGKSSVLEAISMAVFGLSPRFPKKKDFGYLIRSGHKNATIFVQCSDVKDGGEMQLTSTVRINQKSVSLEPLRTPTLFDQVLLNPLSFFEQPAKVRADLVGDVPMKTEEVFKALESRGLKDPVLADATQLIMSLRLAQAEQAFTDRRLQATRNVHEPIKPVLLLNGKEMVQGELAAEHEKWSMAAIQWRNLERAAGTQLAEIEKELSEASNAVRRLANLESMVGDTPLTFQREAELEMVTKQLASSRKEWDEVRDKLLHLPSDMCPNCKQRWTPGADELTVRERALAHDMSELKLRRSSLEGEKANWALKLRLAEEMRAEGDILRKKAAGVSQLEAEAKAARDKMREASDAARKCQEWAYQLHTHTDAMTRWAQATAEQARNVAIREEWDKAVQIIRDPTLKSSLVKDPFERIRQRLVKTSPFFRADVKVTDDLDVMVNGRPWPLLSTAQKLEVSILLADAFAYAGGSRILRVDGIDTLVGSAQVQLVQLIDAIRGDYDTVLMALATEDVPAAYQHINKAERKEPFASWFWVGPVNGEMMVTYRASV